MKGAAEDLNTLDMITIPKDVLDISGAQGSISKTVDITTYLPDGVELVDTAEKNISVTVEIEEASSREFDMPTANITVNNIRSGYEADFSNQTIKVTIAGFASDLEKLDATKLTGSIDANGLKEGEHTLNLTLDLAQEYAASGTQTVSFTIVKSKTTAKPQTTATKTETSDNSTTDTAGSDTAATDTITAGEENAAGETAAGAEN